MEQNGERVGAISFSYFSNFPFVAQPKVGRVPYAEFGIPKRIRLSPHPTRNAYRGRTLLNSTQGSHFCRIVARERVREALVVTKDEEVLANRESASVSFVNL
jgi:hypothetical protein